VLRYGLALVIGWIGMMKFKGYEAQGIEPLVTHCPLLSWMMACGRYVSTRRLEQQFGRGERL
jgi:uncharacterized membrane protein YkgB